MKGEPLRAPRLFGTAESDRARLCGYGTAQQSGRGGLMRCVSDAQLRHRPPAVSAIGGVPLVTGSRTSLISCRCILLLPFLSAGVAGQRCLAIAIRIPPSSPTPRLSDSASSHSPRADGEQQPRSGSDLFDAAHSDCPPLCAAAALHLVEGGLRAVVDAPLPPPAPARSAVPQPQHRRGVRPESQGSGASGYTSGHRSAAAIHLCTLSSPSLLADSDSPTLCPSVCVCAQCTGW